MMMKMVRKCRRRRGRQRSTTLPNATEDLPRYGRIRKRMHYKFTPTVRYLVNIYKQIKDDQTEIVKNRIDTAVYHIPETFGARIT